MLHINQTRQAFFAAQNESSAYESDKTARAVNGEIVRDDESDVDPQDFVGITDPLSETAKALIMKRRTAILRRARRLKAKALAQKRFLCRNISKRTSKILETCPDIGEQIETYVQEHNVGADAWRRTGVLTFDRNIKLKEKVTYEGIRRHLQQVYQKHFSYGTVVELCVARNKRRRSAKRSCADEETGKVDESKWKQNMELAIEAYMSRVNHCPCGDTVIHLFKGANSKEQQRIREKLQIFLKGSQKRKHELQQEIHDLYAWFESVWATRNRHMVPDLPSQYIFLLICCYREDCDHPLCKEGKPDLECTWYPGGPPLTHLPLPLPDPDRPWGNPSCTTCKGFCAGHYRSSVPTDTTDSVALCATSHPPSSMLKELFNKLQGRPITDQFVHDAAKEVLLTPEQVRIWLEHLSTVLQNRRRGAAKAAATRRAKRAKNTCVSNLQSEADPSTVRDSEASCYCGSCRKEYQDETDDVEVWIGCDMCESWYCMSCEGLTNPPELDMYICSKCR